MDKISYLCLAYLEEHSFAVATDSAPDVLGAGQSRVTGDVLEHLGELSGAVVHNVAVYTVIVCDLLQNQTNSIDKLTYHRS
jgi:hypothetical protein